MLIDLILKPPKGKGQYLNSYTRGTTKNLLSFLFDMKPLRLNSSVAFPASHFTPGLVDILRMGKFQPLLGNRNFLPLAAALR